APTPRRSRKRGGDQSRLGEGGVLTASLSPALAWNLLPLLAGLGERDRDGLLAPRHLAALPALTAAERAPLFPAHRARHVLARARAISQPSGFLRGHSRSSFEDIVQTVSRRVQSTCRWIVEQSAVDRLGCRRDCFVQVVATR